MNINISVCLYVYNISSSSAHCTLENENQTRVNFDLSREQCGAASAPIYYYYCVSQYNIYIYMCVLIGSLLTKKLKGARARPKTT